MFEEVKEMIDSTVYENGNGEVTAKNLNLAMHGVVDATEEALRKSSEAIDEAFGGLEDTVVRYTEAVNEIIENGTGGGAGALRWWLADESFGIVNTPEQTQENIATYNKLVEDKYASVMLCYFQEVSSDYIYYSVPVVVQNANIRGEATIVMTNSVAFAEGEPMESIAVLANPDGTMDAYSWIESAPASNGPLRVWL